MVTRGDISLYWMPDIPETNTSEDNISDKIEFNGDAEIPDSRSGTLSTEINVRRRRPKLDNAFEENVIKQDGGFEGSTYTINAIFDESTGTALALARLRNWLGRSNVVRGHFKHGRIGIRNNYRPEFNLIPNNDAGFKLQDVRLKLPSNEARVDATIVLEFSGTPTRFGVRP